MQISYSKKYYCLPCNTKDVYLIELHKFSFYLPSVIVCGALYYDASRTEVFCPSTREEVLVFYHNYLEVSRRCKSLSLTPKDIYYLDNQFYFVFGSSNTHDLFLLIKGWVESLIKIKHQKKLLKVHSLDQIIDIIHKKKYF